MGARWIREEIKETVGEETLGKKYEESKGWGRNKEDNVTQEGVKKNYIA
jgi:hypothetical protein